MSYLFDYQIFTELAIQLILNVGNHGVMTICSFHSQKVNSNIQFHQLVFLVYHFSDTHSIHIRLGNFRNFHQPALIPKTMTATSGPIWRPGKAFRVISCTTLSELLITTLPDWTQTQPFMKRRMLSILFCRQHLLECLDLLK